MRVAAVGRPKRVQELQTKSVQAPIGGWNARDPLALMPPGDAVKLENWFPGEDACHIRGGCANHVTGFAARPKTLALHTPPTGANKMFAATDGGIFDATSAGAVGASVLSRTNGYHVWLQMGVGGGHYLMMFNGTDKPAYFDGATWTAVDGVSTPSITGVTTTNLISAAIHKTRLFLIEKNKMSFWYLPVAVVGGAAVEFPLGPLARKGGFLMAMGTWSFDSGSGPDDFAVFVTSEGEIIVFAGSNPASASDWVLVGVFSIGAKPIGRRCLEKYGGDLVLITQSGVLPLAELIRAKAVDYKLALTDIIQPVFTESARSFGSLEGWEGHILAGQKAFIFNIPQSGTVMEQYVMNTVTQRWCKFTGWNASTFAVFNGELYFADSDKVAKAWSGVGDYGANTVAEAIGAFNYFGKNKQLKDWTLFRPQLRTDGTVSFSIGMAVDFEITNILSTVTYSVTGGAIWDTSLWDTGLWGSGSTIKEDWLTPGARPGFAAAIQLKIATNSIQISWIATDYAYRHAGIL